MPSLPHTLLTLLYLTLASGASPAPPLLTTDFAISLAPRNTLFYRQLADLQTFDSALAGVRASPITNSGVPNRPFDVGGNTFPDFQSAGQRSCDEQFQGCQLAANQAGNGNGNNNGGKKQKRKKRQDGKGKGKGRDEGAPGNANPPGNANANGGLTVNMCDQQKDRCNQAQQTATVQDFQTGVASTNIGPDPLFPDFDLICEG